MPWVIQHLLLMTCFIVAFAVGLVVLVLLVLTRIYTHEATRFQFGSGLVSILVAVLFSVILSNLYAVRRDRDNRLRALRDQHFGRLRPVLRTESAKLQEIATLVAQRAHISGVTQYQNVLTIAEDALWPDVMSRDLGEHFPAYDRSKRNLLSEIKSQDEEFRAALSDAERHIKPIANLDPYWREVAAMSFVEFCTGRGEGMKLRISEGGYTFKYWGAETGGSGGGLTPPRPSPDQVVAFRAYQSLRRDDFLASRCDNLKRRAEAIVHTAQELSREAQLQSESTILKGTCDFLRSDSLSD